MHFIPGRENIWYMQISKPYFQSEFSNNLLSCDLCTKLNNFPINQKILKKWRKGNQPTHQILKLSSKFDGSLPILFWSEDLKFQKSHQLFLMNWWTIWNVCSFHSHSCPFHEKMQENLSRLAKKSIFFLPHNIFTAFLSAGEYKKDKLGGRQKVKIEQVESCGKMNSEERFLFFFEKSKIGIGTIFVWT